MRRWGLLLAVVALGGCVDFKGTDAKRERARMDLKNIEAALRLYYSQQKRYPTQEQGLGVLQRAGMLVELPEDPWGRPYEYAVIEGKPLARTLGRDGAPGGQKEDSDLASQPVR